jgi:hypothetical protein
MQLGEAGCPRNLWKRGNVLRTTVVEGMKLFVEQTTGSREAVTAV